MCLGNWLFKELLSSSKCLCLRLWIDLSQQHNHPKSQGDSRFPVHFCHHSIPCSSLPFFPRGVFCISAQEVPFHGLFFSYFPGCLVSSLSCSLPGRLVNCPTLVSVCIRTSGSFGFAENHLLYHVYCILVLGVGIRPVLHALTS